MLTLTAMIEGEGDWAMEGGGTCSGEGKGETSITIVGYERGKECLRES